MSNGNGSFLYGTPTSTNKSLSVISSRQAQDERVQDAIAEESHKRLRALSPTAISALEKLIGIRSIRISRADSNGNSIAPTQFRQRILSKSRTRARCRPARSTKSLRASMDWPAVLGLCRRRRP